MTRIEQIENDLVQCGLLRASGSSVTPMSGGVSSDIYLIDDGKRRIVVKQALDRLKVEDDWQVDVSRNVTEQRFIRHVSGFLPRSMPRILHCNAELNYFAMEYLADSKNWKSMLMAGDVDSDLARRAGGMLGTIHRKTWGDPSLKRQFDTTRSFHALRTEPYLLTTAARHPPLSQQINDEARRLEETRRCLIHGDFSPKNIMIGSDAMVLLDCEVAWFGEPAFDAAFLFNHFLLKTLLDRGNYHRYLSLVPAAWDSYRACFPKIEPDMEQRTGRLLLMLMLARLDGKSPVEYLGDDLSRQVVRDFVYSLLPRQIFAVDEICSLWAQRIDAMEQGTTP